MLTPSIQQFGFQRAISRRRRLSCSQAGCRFPSFPLFFSGKLSFEGRLLCRTFSCFVSCLLGGLPSRSRLLGRPALRNPDLSRGDNGFLAAWRSTTTRPNVLCAVSRSAAKTTSSPVPMRAADAPPLCTR